jgi:chromosome partitioning protein
MRRIALVNQKGGCGKTTTAINLTAFLAKEGRNVLLIDLDPQGHAGLGLGVNAEEMETTVYEVLLGKIPLDDAIQPLKKNLDIVLSDVVLSAFEQVMSGASEREYKLAQSLEKMEAFYDYVVIDSPPSVGLLTFNGLMASDEVIIPVDSSYFSLHGLGKLLDTIQIIEEKAEHHLSIKILATNIDRRTNFCKGVVETLTTHFPDRCFKSVIHTCTRLREAASHGKPLSTFDKHCNAYDDYQRLAREILSEEAHLVEETGKRARVPVPTEREEKAIVFTIEAPPNARVQIAGDFNGWKPEVLHFTDRRGTPAWQKLFTLKPGKYQYKYLIDGQWTTDPENKEIADDSVGGSNSVVRVSR